MLLATVLSAYAGVFLEKLFKTVQLTLWLQSIQLSVFALPVSCLTMLIYDSKALADGTLFVGFHRWAWLTVVLSALGGIAVSMTLKYADNILKTFAVGCSIVLNCLVSSLLLGVPLSLQVLCGVLLVVGSTFLFNARNLRPGGSGGEARGGSGGSGSGSGSMCAGGGHHELTALRGDERGTKEEHEPLTAYEVTRAVDALCSKLRRPSSEQQWAVSLGGETSSCSPRSPRCSHTAGAAPPLAAPLAYATPE
jgi:hypothetical protein